MEAANGTRPIEKDDLFRLRFLQAARLSPDGRQVVYGIGYVDADEEKEYHTLWLLDLASGEHRQLTNGDASDTDPAWSPDSRSIAFQSTRGGAPQIYIINTRGGEARQLTKMPQGASGPAWSPDGRHIAYTSGPSMDTPLDPNNPFRVTRHVYRFDAVGYLDPAVHDIYVIHADGGEARQITSDAAMNANPCWSPDGRRLLFSATFQADRHFVLYLRLMVADLIDGSIHDVFGEWGTSLAAAWQVDGERIVFVGQPDGQLIGSKNDLYTVAATGGTPENRSAGIEWHVGGANYGDMPARSLTLSPLVIDPAGEDAYVQVQEGGHTDIYRISLAGEESWSLLHQSDEVHYTQDVQAGQLLYTRNSTNQPPDLYISDVDGSNERQLTQINDEFLAGIALPELRHLQYKGEDGTDVEGWVIVPAGSEGPQPAVLYIHGGPNAAYGNCFAFDFQMLAGAGYAVMYFNHRASTGYGHRFATMIKGDWGNHDYKDLMAGVDCAIENGLVDSERMGVCGTSGGGNLTSFVIGNTDRFKAAIPCNPVTSWWSFYGTSDIGVWFALEQLGGHPWEIPETYARCSPITYAHNCTTPTLCVQAEHDWRCPAEQSEQLYATLKAVGCHVEMLRQPNGSHGASTNGEPIMRRVHNEAMLDWFNHYLLGHDRRDDIV